jgi:hypothetical protein
MDRQEERRRDTLGRVAIEGYEPPRVERVLSPADLASEILYAGVPTAPPPP